MFIKLQNFVFIRNILNQCVIMDRLNEKELIGDFNLWLFLKHVTYIPENIDTITKNIKNEFIDDINIEDLKKDVLEIFFQLSEYGFLSIGKTIGECNENSYTFSYKNPNIISTFKKTTEYDENKIKQFRKDYGEKPPLSQVLVEITKICNERCIHCYIPHENKTFLMSENDFYKIVDECYELGTVTDFRISGGECMSHPNFKDFIKYVKAKGFFLNVLTNLTLLDDEIIEILKTGSLSTVQTSIFSMDPEIHDTITQVKGSHALLLKNLEKLYKANIPVSLATQVIEQNKDSLSDIYDYANAHNFQVRCDFAIIAQENSNIENLKYVPQDISSCYRKIFKVRMDKANGYKNFMKDLLNKPLKNENDFLCNACLYGFTITPDLFVESCPGWSLKLGDLHKESISDIWNNSLTIKKIRKATLKNFPKCMQCENRSICHICMAQAYNEKNCSLDSFEMPERVCQIYKLFREFCSEQNFE